MRIAVDMDEVIADARAAQLEWLRRNFTPDRYVRAVEDRPLRLLLEEDVFDALQSHLHEGEFFGYLEPIQGSQEALRRLSTKHEVFISTAAFEYPASLTYKHEWLRRHFPFLDPLRFVFCGDKSIIAADVLVDDSSRHFLRFKGDGLLFDAPHNRDQTVYPRARGWAEAEAWLEQWTGLSTW